LSKFFLEIKIRLQNSTFFRKPRKISESRDPAPLTGWFSRALKEQELLEYFPNPVLCPQLLVLIIIIVTIINMPKLTCLTLFIFLLVATQSQPTITHLECEHLLSPLGIDATNPRLSWQINDASRGALQTTYQVFLSPDSLAVSNEEESAAQTAKFLSDDQLVEYKGESLHPFTKYYWAVKVWDQHDLAAHSPVAHFETGMMKMKNWHAAWIKDSRDINLKPAPYFRKTFTVSKKIVSARAYIAAAGLYELYINGKKIGDHVLDPMYTRFDRRNLYLTYDVTDDLQDGNNVIGVHLGNGWFNLQSTAVWYFDKAPWRARPTFCMDLRITYTDSSVETIATDKSWKTALSPIVFNSIYTGEHYDATKEISHWNESSFEDSSWKPVIYASAPSQNITAQTTVPIRALEKIPAVSINKINDTDYVFDIGRNIAGVSSITVAGNSGTIIKLKHGERLYKNGHVDQSNIDVHYRPTDDSDPFQTDIYYLRPDRTETFSPNFNYKGFQYVEVTSNKPIALTAASLTAYFMHSDVPAVGTISSSNPILNKIWAAANVSYLSNLYGYPTDCPQREKNGWTGDAQINVETGLYNFDAITVYEKWMGDHRDEQQANGVLPSIIPSSGWGYEWGNGPDWTSSIAIIPWNLYLFYGDPKALKDNYDNIKRYVDHINDLFPSGLCSWGLGDWIPVKSKSPVELTSTAYYFADVTILSAAANLFHKEADKNFYSALAAKIKDTFNKKYLNESTAIYFEGTQTEMSVPLFWGLVPENLKPKVAANLAARVIKDSIRLDVGLLGTKTILNALSENGYADLAYQLASGENYPSWGWWIKNGATALYEDWKLDAGASQNHIMFGEISAWMYKALGGIKTDPASPGFKNILLHPYFPRGLDHFEVTHEGPYGLIRSTWKRTGKEILYTVTIPPNSSADLILEGVKANIRQHLTAGTYSFTIF
jgi:alpha-L-rhamnosidase